MICWYKAPSTNVPLTFAYTTHFHIKDYFYYLVNSAYLKYSMYIISLGVSEASAK